MLFKHIKEASYISVLISMICFISGQTYDVIRVGSDHEALGQRL